MTESTNTMERQPITTRIQTLQETDLPSARVDGRNELNFAIWRRVVIGKNPDNDLKQLRLQILENTPQLWNALRHSPSLRLVVSDAGTLRNIYQLVTREPNLLDQIDGNGVDVIRTLIEKRLKKTELRDTVDSVFFDRSEEVRTRLKKMELRNKDGSEIEWQREFGTEAKFQRFQEVITEAIKGFKTLDSSLAQNQDTLDFLHQVKVEKKAFRNNDGELVTYYFYHVPEQILALYVQAGEVNGKLLLQLPKVDPEHGVEVKDVFKEHHSKGYASETPMLEFGVRSLEAPKLTIDHGPVVFTGGWTANSFEIAKKKRNSEKYPDDTSILEDLLGWNDVGHSVVFVAPSLHFEGAYNEKGLETLRSDPDYLNIVKQKYPDLYEYAVAGNDFWGRFYDILYSSGTATQFYEDQLHLLGVYNFIGHSRGGRVASQLSYKNHLRIKLISCLALMPAETVEEPLNLLPAAAGDVTMRERFSQLGIATFIGGNDIVQNNDATATISNIATWIITHRLIKDPILDLSQYQDLRNTTVEDHRKVIQKAYWRAVSKVIMGLGKAHTMPWTYLRPSWMFAFKSVGLTDKLSKKASLEKYFTEENEQLLYQLSPWLVSGYEGDVIKECRRATTFIAELRDKKGRVFDGGHYAYLAREVRRPLFEKWWRHLSTITPNEKSLDLARMVLEKPQRYLAQIISSEVLAQFPDPSLALVDTRGGEKKQIILLAPEAFEQLRRTLVITTRNVNAMDDLHNQMIESTRGSIPLKEVSALVSQFENQLFENWWERMSEAGFPSEKLNLLRDIANKITENNVQPSVANSDLLQNIFAIELSQKILIDALKEAGASTKFIEDFYNSGKTKARLELILNSIVQDEEKLSAALKSWVDTYDKALELAVSLTVDPVSTLREAAQKRKPIKSLGESLKVLMWEEGRPLIDRKTAGETFGRELAGNLWRQAVAVKLTQSEAARQVDLESLTTPYDVIDNWNVLWSQFVKKLPELGSLDADAEEEIRKNFNRLHRQLLPEFLAQIALPPRKTTQPET